LAEIGVLGVGVLNLFGVGKLSNFLGTYSKLFSQASQGRPFFHFFIGAFFEAKRLTF